MDTVQAGLLSWEILKISIQVFICLVIIGWGVYAKVPNTSTVYLFLGVLVFILGGDLIKLTF